ncbi:MAG: PilZ domain-containing protein [Phycisphaerales bacterium]|nr:PilZ domain-containing protein [Planctomycetota bacterium]MCH8509430.1 PilZ domain-containing protein [Phycisphaerales bacterium]
MIMPIGTALACRCSDGVRADGVVTASRDGVVEARFEGKGPFEKGSCVEIRFAHEEDGRVWVVGACVERVGSAGVSVLALSGEAAPENQRAAYRVVTACADVLADIGRQRDCRVLDVSEGGLATELVNAPHAGTVCEIKLRAFGRTVQGRFVLRHARPARLCPGGEVSRCGLQVAGGQPELTRAMRELVMEAQRAQLRNRSRLTGRTRAATAADAPSNAGATAERTPPDGSPAPAGDQPESKQPSTPGDIGSLLVRLMLDQIIGKPMPFSLRDREGRIVVGRGEVIDAQAAARIATSDLEICEDWFAPDPKAKGAERRLCERRACHAEVRVWLIEPDGARSVRAEMVDISRGGAGVRTQGVAHRGEVVVVQFGSGPIGGWIVARVESSVVTPDSAISRLGLRFMQSCVQHTPMPPPADMRRIVEPFRGTERQRRVQSA